MQLAFQSTKLIFEVKCQSSPVQSSPCSDYRLPPPLPPPPPPSSLPCTPHVSVLRGIWTHQREQQLQERGKEPILQKQIFQPNKMAVWNHWNGTSGKERGMELLALGICLNAMGCGMCHSSSYSVSYIFLFHHWVVHTASPIAPQRTALTTSKLIQGMAKM